MYTYTERKTAVLLYIKYNRKATITVRELGYPSIRMLRNWYYEYLEFGDLHKEHLKKPNKYSIEERKYAVDYYIEHGLILAETVRSLGYPHIETLRKWGWSPLEMAESRKCHQFNKRIYIGLGRSGLIKPPLF